MFNTLMNSDLTWPCDIAMIMSKNVKNWSFQKVKCIEQELGNIIICLIVHYVVGIPKLSSIAFCQLRFLSLEVKNLKFSLSLSHKSENSRVLTVSSVTRRSDIGL